MTVVFTLFFVGECSSKIIQKVDVYEMESFTNIIKDSLTSFTESIITQIIAWVVDLLKSDMLESFMKMIIVINNREWKCADKWCLDEK